MDEVKNVSKIIEYWIKILEGTWKLLEIHEVKKCSKHNFKKSSKKEDTFYLTNLINLLLCQF